jgi:hypothetical protein
MKYLDKKKILDNNINFGIYTVHIVELDQSRQRRYDRVAIQLVW